MTRSAIDSIRPANATRGVRPNSTKYAGACLLCAGAVLALATAVLTTALTPATPASQPPLVPLLRLVLVGGVSVPAALSR